MNFARFLRVYHTQKCWNIKEIRDDRQMILRLPATHLDTSRPTAHWQLCIAAGGRIENRRAAFEQRG